MRFSGVDKAAISERNDYGYGCILSVYEKGVPTIIKKYGKEIFEITDNYVKCKIPFDKGVLELSNKNVGLNIGLNVGLNKTEKAVLRLLIENSDRTADVIAAEIGVTKRTIERAFVSLQKKRKIERIGSKRDGMWGVIQ